jgi:hypothetical protein
MVDRLIAFIIAQTCRQPGLSVVYSELFSFEGAALYFLEQPALVGSTYGEALYRCERAAPLGIQFQDGRVQLNPPMDTVIQPGDQLIAIAASEDSIQLSSQPEAAIHWAAIQDVQSPVVVLERPLILGWNRRGAMILEQLSQYVPAGSQGRVVAPVDPEQMQADCAGINLGHLQMTFERGNYTDRATLEKLSAEGYQYIIILNPMEAVDIQIADATTIVSLLT